MPSETVLQLYELLRYMKEECQFYPITSGFERDGIWDSDELNKLKSPSNQAYFVYLGILETGLYQLSLEGIDAHAESCIEVIDDEFDYYEKEQIQATQGKMVLQFYADKRSAYYLRITTRRPVALTRIELALTENNPASK